MAAATLLAARTEVRVLEDGIEHSQHAQQELRHIRQAALAGGEHEMWLDSLCEVGLENLHQQALSASLLPAQDRVSAAEAAERLHRMEREQVESVLKRSQRAWAVQSSRSAQTLADDQFLALRSWTARRKRQSRVV